MAKIKNELYNKFLKGDFIELIDEARIKEVLNNVKGKYVNEARALIILAYYTGARPEEYLRLKPLDCMQVNKWLHLKVPAVKNGIGRIIILDTKKDLVSELFKYIKSVFPQNYLFMHFRGGYTYKCTIKSKQNPFGKYKEYVCTSYKLRYWFKKWFGNINPYYLRHNRFSKLAMSGVPIQDIKQMKGSKTLDSVNPYIHMSTDTAKKIAKKND